MIKDHNNLCLVKIDKNKLFSLNFTNYDDIIYNINNITSIFNINHNIFYYTLEYFKCLF